MTQVYRVGLACISALLLYAGCGSKDDKAASDKPAGFMEQMEKASKEMEDAAKEMESAMSGSKEPVPPVSFRTLIEFLPKEYAGLAPGKPEGESQTMGEWSFSHARNSYRSEDGARSAEIEIFDYAHIAPMYMTYNALFKLKFKREDTDGYEQSVSIMESPAYEKWSEGSGEHEISLLVGERFIVKALTRGLGDGSARKLLEQIDVKRLAQQKAA